MEPLHLLNTAFAITERCTLRCRLCIAYIPYHDNPRDTAIAEVDTILGRYFELVSDVDRFCLTGGEPLLHPGLLSILKMLERYSDRINRTVDIITNGTLMFGADVLGLLEDMGERARVIVSDYGRHSPKANALVSALRSRGVGFRVERYHGPEPLHGGWVDCNDHSRKHFTQAETDEQGLNCHYKLKRGFPIRKGEIHNCARAYWRMLTGVVPRNKDEYVDLLDTEADVEEQRTVLRRMLNVTSCSSCAYCSGANVDSRRYPPAEQLSGGRA